MSRLRRRRWKARDGHCSFCGKAPTQVGKLIAGPGVWICHECVGLCVEIIDRERGARRIGERLAMLPTYVALLVALVTVTVAQAVGVRLWRRRAELRQAAP